MTRATTVLCLSGHDPGGGAGLQADIETLAAHGVHALGVITALTVQDSHNVRRVIATDPALLDEQLDMLLADVQPDAVKLGLLGAIDQLSVIVRHLARLAVPVVCDPVLRAGGGTDLVAIDYPAELRRRLLPHVTVLTPNASEARRLVPGAGGDLDACAAALLADGCQRVLITGGDEAGASVINHLHAGDGAEVDDGAAPPGGQTARRVQGRVGGATAAVESEVGREGIGRRTQAEQVALVVGQDHPCASARRRRTARRPGWR